MFLPRNMHDGIPLSHKKNTNKKPKGNNNLRRNTTPKPHNPLNWLPLNPQSSARTEKEQIPPTQFFLNCHKSTKAKENPRKASTTTTTRIRREGGCRKRRGEPRN
jgi:hypothetical protein